MSTATQAPPSDSSRYVDYDEFIDFQVQKTRAGIKTNDLLTALIAGSTAVLAYVLVFAVFDHWIIDGGFGRGMRFGLLSLLVVGLGGWCVWKLVLPYFRRVSALYAAKEIEEAEPEFHSTLVTLIDLKQAGREVPPEIRAALEKRAGLGLTHMDVEQAVDRRLLMRLSYVLLGLVVITCLYTIFSPKKLSNSLWRALLPASAVAVDTRTEIDRVEPGDVDVLARAQLEVTADLSGELPDEVTLLYTTADHRLVDEPIAMRETEGGLRRFRGVITGENGRGILQNLTYHVVAGDATSPTYAVTVKQPPSATVEDVRYEFPKYMQFNDRTQMGGSIDSWEGTWVTVRATANMPLESAVVKFSDTEDISNKAEEQQVKIENGTQLTARWQLKIRSDGTYPNFYRIHCRNDAGEEDPNPSLHPVKIRADQPPQIQLAQPTGDIERPANATVPLLFAAHDPDFKLRSVILHLEQNGETLPQSPRLYEGPPYRQSVSDTYNLDLSQLVLSPGDRLTYWLEARDNLEPFADRSGNRTNTPRLNITILEAAAPEEVQQQLEEDQQQIEERLEQAAEQPEADGSQPPPADESEDAAPPPPNDDPSAGEEQTPQPTDAGEPADANGQSQEQSDGTADESAGQQQRRPGEGQNRQTGDQSDGAGEQQSGEPGESGQQGNEEAPFEDLLEKLMQKERQREQQQDSGQEQSQEQQPSDQQTQDSPADAAERTQEMSESSSAGEQGESGEPQRGEPQGGESAEQSPESGESTSPESGESQSSAPSGEESASNPSESRSPSDEPSSPTDVSNGNVTEGSEDSQPTSENPPVQQGTADGGERMEKDPTQSPSGDTQSDEPAGTDGQPTNPDETASKNPMPGKPDGSAEGDPSKADDPMQGDQNEESRKVDEPQPSSSEDSQSPKASDADPSGEKPGDGEQGTQKQGTEKRPQTSDDAPSDAPSDASGADQASPKTDPSPPADEGGKPQGGESSGDSPMGTGEAGTPSEGGESGGEQSAEGGSPSEGPSDGQGAQPSQGQPGGEGGQPSEGQQPSGGQEGQGGQPGEQSEGSPQGGQPDASSGASEQSGGETQSGEAGSGNSRSGGGNWAPSGTDKAQPGGGGAGDGEGDADQGQGGEGAGDNIQGDDPDLESKRKAANLVLKRLEDQLQRGEIDPELQEELGVTEEQLREFTDRLRQRLADTSDDNSPETKARRMQFQETLKNLDYDSTGTARDGGERPREAAGGFAGPQRKAPARRRDATRAYRERLSRQRQSAQ